MTHLLLRMIRMRTCVFTKLLQVRIRFSPVIARIKVTDGTPNFKHHKMGQRKKETWCFLEVFPVTFYARSACDICGLCRIFLRITGLFHVVVPQPVSPRRIHYSLRESFRSNINFSICGGGEIVTRNGTLYLIFISQVILDVTRASRTEAKVRPWQQGVCSSDWG